MDEYDHSTQYDDLKGAVDRAKKHHAVQMSGGAKAMLAGLGILAAAGLGGGIYALANRDAELKPGEYVAGQFLVKFEDEISVRLGEGNNVITGLDEVDALNSVLEGEVYEQLVDHPEDLEVDNIYLVTVSRHADIEQLAEEFAAAEGIEWAEPNYIDTFPDEPAGQPALGSLYDAGGAVTPNDRYFSTRGAWGQDFPDMWGLHASNAPAAWEITRGSDDVIIAVIDTGVDYTHPDLAGRVLQGYDFMNMDTDAMDDHGHGSHVAGTIAATTNNSLGVAGINWQGMIMPIKVCNSGGSCPRSAIIEGIVYAADHDADVINMSLGGRGGPQAYDEAIRYADSKGVIIVVAAGNNNEDTAGFTPANHPYVIAVAAIGPDGNRTSFSNWGPKVDVGAPGQGILSTVPERHHIPTSRYHCLVAEDGIHNYCELAGTSMASPHVAGEVALILAANPDLRGQREEVRKIVREAITPYDREQDRPVGRGRINLAEAVRLAQEHESEE